VVNIVLLVASLEACVGRNLTHQNSVRLLLSSIQQSLSLNRFNTPTELYEFLKTFSFLGTQMALNQMGFRSGPFETYLIPLRKRHEAV